MDLKAILLKLGVSSEDLDKYEKGEIDAGAIAAGTVDKIETTVKARIEEVVVEDKKKELFNAAYNQIEKAVIKAGGDLLDLKKYEGIEKGRVKTMIADLRAGFEEKVRAAEDKAAKGDADALADYRDRLSAANSMIDKMKTDHAAAISEREASFQKYKADQKIGGQLSALLGGLQNARLDADSMRDIFEAETRRRGVSFRLADDGGIVAIDGDGRPMRNPEKPSENLGLSDVFSDVAASRRFVKESNGAEENRRRIIAPNGGDGKSNVHPNFLKAYGDK